MLDIYSHKQLLPKGTQLINDCDAEFDELVDFGLPDTELTKGIIQRVDGSKRVSDKAIQTKFGDLLGLTYLSTGCKTALLVTLLGRKKCINTIQCGDNALLEILKLDQGILLMPFSPITDVNFAISVRVFTRLHPDGVICTNFFDFFYIMKGDR